MIKILQKSVTALFVAVLLGGIVTIGIELFIEVNPLINNVDRTYNSGLWASDLAIVVGILAGLWGSIWGWGESDGFRELVLVDFFGWIRGLFTPR